MTKGGYQIIDFSGIKFTRDKTVTVKNVHEKIESTRKAILISGLEVDGVEYRDTFVNFNNESGNYVGSMYDVTINIGTDGNGNDPVTITNV